MPDFTAISVADMRAVFPTRPETIRGEPTLLKLLRILKYLMECSQTHESSLSVCNLLFLCIPPELYATYTNTIYPLLPADPGVTPNYDHAIDAADRATIKAEFANDKMIYDEVKNMNKALTEEFIALVNRAHTEEFRQNRISHPNQSFRAVFQTFLALYGESDETDQKGNLNRMEADWNPNEGIQKLINQISSGIEYAHFAQQPISDAVAVDIGIRSIMKSGLFSHDYELWQGQLDKSWLNFGVFWKQRTKLKKKTVRAGHLGYGMNATEEAAADEESTRLLEESVSQFGQAHAATQASIKSLTANNSSLTNNVAAAMNMMQQQMNNMQSSMQNLAMAGMNQKPATQPHAQQHQFQFPPKHQNQPPPQQYYPPPQYPQQQQQHQQQQQQGGRGGGRGGRGRGGGRGGRGRGHQGGRGGYNAQYQQNNQGQQFIAPPNPNKFYDNEEYCHTHGADIPDGHNSGTCGRPGPNHQWAATRHNAMGGTAKASHKVNMPSGRTLTPCVGCAPPRNSQSNYQQWGNYGGQYGM